MGAGLWYFFLTLLVAKLRPCISRGSSWLPSHSSSSSPLTPQWWCPNGPQLCLNHAWLLTNLFQCCLCWPLAVDWLLTWPITVCLPGSLGPQHNILSLPWLKVPGRTIFSASFLLSDMRFSPLWSAFHAAISGPPIPQAWNADYSFKNWQQFKSDLEPVEWCYFITWLVKWLGTLGIH
jgi:hypothetical protein